MTVARTRTLVLIILTVVATVFFLIILIPRWRSGTRQASNTPSSSPRPAGKNDPAAADKEAIWGPPNPPKIAPPGPGGGPSSGSQKGNITAPSPVRTTPARRLDLPFITKGSVEIRPERLPTPDNSEDIYFSLLTAPVYHNLRFSLQYLTWLQTINPKQVRKCSYRKLSLLHVTCR